MAQFWTGHIPDPEGHRHTSFDHYKVKFGAAGLALEIDLGSLAPIGPSGKPEHFDQDQTGSCEGHANSAALVTAFAAAGRPLAFIPSPVGIYTIARCIDRVQAPDGSWPPLTDDGAMTNQVMRGLSTYGVRPIRTLLGRFSDSDPATINDEPKLDEIEEDSQLIVVGESAILSFGSQRVADLCTAIAGGVGVTSAINGGCDAFQQYTSGVLTGAALAGELDHEIFINAYRTVAGRKEFRIWNSWSDGWGEGGNAWIDESAVATLGDIYAIVARKG